MFDGVRVGAEQPGTVILDQRLHDGGRIAVRHLSRWIIGIKCQRMATAAMFIHRNRQHPCTAGFQNVTFRALDNAPAIGRYDARCIDMHGMIETQIRVLSALYCIEFRMRIEKVRGVLKCKVIGGVRMTVCA